MNETTIFSDADLTEEQAKAEIGQMLIEMRRVLDSIRRDREEGERTDARIDAKMAEIRDALAELRASR